MKSSIRLIAIITAVLSMAFLCQTASASAKPTQVRFVVSYRSVLLGSLPSYIAVKKGYFKKYGVDVKYINGSGGGTTLRMLSTGNADMASGGLAAAILAARTDPKIELVGDYYHSANVMVWIAPSNTHIHSVSDLKNAKLGYSHPASASQLLARLSIKRAKIPGAKLVSVGGMGDCWTAAKAGVITAGWANEPFLSEKIKNDNAKIVLKPGDYIKHFYLNGIDVNKKFATEHPNAVRGVFKGLEDGIEFVRNHPNQAAAIGAKQFHTSKAVIAEGIQRYLNNHVWDLTTDAKAFNTVIRGMVSNGQLPHMIDIGKLLNQGYLPKKFRRKIN